MVNDDAKHRCWADGAAYVLLLYIALSAPAYARAHPHLDPMMVAAWPVALGCTVALAGIMMAVFEAPSRRSSRNTTPLSRPLRGLSFFRNGQRLIANGVLLHLNHVAGRAASYLSDAQQDLLGEFVQ